MYVSKTRIQNISPSLRVTAQNKFIDVEKETRMADEEQIFGNLS